MSTTITTTSVSGNTSLWAYTYAELKNAAKHAMGKEPDATTSLGEIVNDALQVLASLHPWSWRRRKFSGLETVADQEHVDLPADFAQIHTIHCSTFENSMSPASLDQIEWWRNQTTVPANFGHYHYAVTYAPQASAAALPTARLELYPTPTAAVEIRGVYLRVIPVLDGDNELPDIPANFHPLLKYLVRGTAVDDEEQAANRDMERFGQLLTVLKQEDGLLQGSLGQMRGGLYDRRVGEGIFSPRPISL